MIKDMEGHGITLADSPNPHILSTGISGYGKTYLNIRLLESIYNQGRNALVIDFTNSYSEKELMKNQLECPFRILNPCKDLVNLNWGRNMEADLIENAIIRSFGDIGYNQEKLLKAACQKIFQEKNSFSFPALIELLKTEFETYQAAGIMPDECHHIEKLIHRLNTIADIDNLLIATNEGYNRNISIDILQLSDIGPRARKIIFDFCVSLLWSRTIQAKEDPRYDVLLIDEIQNISLSPSSDLYHMLRESRKFNLQLILSTQSLLDFGKEELTALMQVGTIFFFRPTPTDMKGINEMLRRETGWSWSDISPTLERGQAILRGNYHINERRHVVSTPILVTTQKTID